MTGLDRWRLADFAPVAGLRVGLLTHPAAVSDLAGRPLATAAGLFAAHTNLVALFAPEHGATGEAQDLVPVVAAEGARIRAVSLYGDTFDSLKPSRDHLADLDVLVVDLVDVGSRYYTFQATLLYCLEACAPVGLPVVVLDRPNPLGRTVEGPGVAAGFESFVGPHDICTRHGLTLGELARLYRAERVPAVDLTVVPCDDGPVTFTLPPSPNMPTVATARVYPGMCLVEGTNLSEGRGTTRPFEYVGFPGVDPAAAADLLNHEDLPGVDFLPVTFRPTFQKHANRSCGGVMVVPRDATFRPVRTGLAVLVACRLRLGGQFQWRTKPYEFVADIPAIDLLFGSDRERTAIDAGATWQDIAGAWNDEEAAFAARRAPHLMAPGPDAR